MINFIIGLDSVEVDKKATYHLKKPTFLKSFFSRKEYKLSSPDDKYYKNPIVRHCMKLIQHPLFDGSIMIVIILNTICLALDKEPAFDKEILESLSILNRVFTVIFTLEVVIKMTALGIKEFWKDGFNIFDLFIVVTSIAQLFMTKAGKGGMFLMVFRTFRVFRIFKLFKNGDLRLLSDSIIFTISTVGPYALFLTFFIYIFALVGMSFFAGKFRFNSDFEVDFENGSPPRENFDDLGSTLISLMNMMFGTWHVIMMNAMRTTS